MNDISKEEFGLFLKEVKTKVLASQYQALKAVNKELISLYWEIGKLIVEKQDKSGWGKSIVELLAKELQLEFPGMRGFSARNLWNIRNFYVSYKESTKLQSLTAEIGWTHNIKILDRCKDDLEREFYIKMTIKYGWTINILVHHLEQDSYRSFLTNQTNFDKSLPEKYKNQAKLAVKDEYIFDFLELSEEHSERELEASLVNNMRKFLAEIGDEFAFIGSQYKLEVGDEEFYIDLLLYHRKLRSLVAIELKIGKFKPEYVGKMQFYLTALNKTKKLEGENPAIGIIVCKSKNRTIVEYTLNDSDKPIGVSTYKTNSKLPKSMQNLLPSAEEIIKRLSVLDSEI